MKLYAIGRVLYDHALEVVELPDLPQDATLFLAFLTSFTAFWRLLATKLHLTNAVGIQCTSASVAFAVASNAAVVAGSKPTYALLGGSWALTRTRMQMSGCHELGRAHGGNFW
jgi:hypothetical protein